MGLLLTCFGCVDFTRRPGSMSLLYFCSILREPSLSRRKAWKEICFLLDRHDPRARTHVLAKVLERRE